MAELLQVALADPGPEATAGPSGGGAGRSEATPWESLVRAMLEAGADPTADYDPPEVPEGAAGDLLWLTVYTCCELLSDGSEVPPWAPGVTRCGG